MDTDPHPTPSPLWWNGPPPPSQSPRNIVTPSRQESKNNNTDRDYIYDNFRRVMYDSLKLFGLGFGASETEVKVQFRTMSRIYHPYKHKTEHTGITDEDATTLFHIMSNAHSCFS